MSAIRRVLLGLLLLTPGVLWAQDEPGDEPAEEAPAEEEPGDEEPPFLEELPVVGEEPAAEAEAEPESEIEPEIEPEIEFEIEPEIESESEIESEIESEVDLVGGDSQPGSRGVPGGRQESTAENRNDGGDRADQAVPPEAIGTNSMPGAGQNRGEGGGLEIEPEIETEPEPEPEPESASPPEVAPPPPPPSPKPSPLAFLSETIRWTGYYENQLAIYALPRNEHGDPDGSAIDILDYNKAKLGIRFKPTRGFSVQVDLVAIGYLGSEYHLADMLPERFESDLEALEAMDPSAVRFTLPNEIYLDNAYLSAQAGRFRLKVGKQPIRFGSGYLWNPSDPFNIKDMLDPSYEKRGVTALRLQLFLPHEFLVEVYALPDPFGGTKIRLEDSAVAARVRAAFGQFVVAAHVATMVDTAGVDPMTMDPDEYKLRSRRHLVGLEFVGELGGVGFWLEGAYNRMPRGDWGDDDLEFIGRAWWFEALAGVSYTFPGGFMAMAEYLYNQRGDNDPDDTDLIQWFAYLEQELRYLNKHQLAITLQLPIERAFTTIGLTAIVTPASPAAVINPSVQFNWSQHFSLMVYGALSFAKEPDAEYAAMGNGAYLRFRFSF